jgi:hypothetical protein
MKRLEERRMRRPQPSALLGEMGCVVLVVLEGGVVSKMGSKREGLEGKGMVAGGLGW